MHISDGILPVEVLVGGYIAGGALCAWSTLKMRDEEIPRTAVFTAAFFLASLIHFKFAITSFHLLMNGLVGIVLGKRCCIAIALGLFLQAALLGHGGLSSLGVNFCIFSIPALCVWRIYEYLQDKNSISDFFLGLLCGGIAVFISGILFMLAILTIGNAEESKSVAESFWYMAQIAFIAHIPIIIVEGIVTGFTIQFLNKVQPMLIRKEVS